MSLSNIQGSNPFSGMGSTSSPTSPSLNEGRTGENTIQASDAAGASVGSAAISVFVVTVRP